MSWTKGWLAAGLVAAVAMLPAPAGAQAPFDGVGPQLRLTQIGNDGDPAFDALDPEVAYNSLQDEFLLVWSGIHPSVPGETEIYGMILDGTGAPKGP